MTMYGRMYNKHTTPTPAATAAGCSHPITTTSCPTHTRRPRTAHPNTRHPPPATDGPPCRRGVGATDRRRGRRPAAGEVDRGGGGASRGGGGQRRERQQRQGRPQEAGEAARGGGGASSGGRGEGQGRRRRRWPQLWPAGCRAGAWRCQAGRGSTHVSSSRPFLMANVRNWISQ